MMNHQRLAQGFFFALLLSVGVLMFFILQPYLSTLLLAAVVAVMVWPLHRRLSAIVARRKSLAALVSTALILIIVVLPLTLIGFQLFFEVRGIYAYFASPAAGGSSVAANFAHQLEQTIHSYVPNLAFDANQYVERGLGWLLSNLGTVFSSLAVLILHVFLFVLTLFFLFRDGEQLLSRIRRLSPLADRDDSRIFNTLENAINSVVRGYLVVALIQGVLAGIGLSLFSVPNAVLWGSITVIAALIPTFGTSIIMAPAIAYLAFTGQNVAAIGLTIWAATAVGLIDNLLAPALIGKGASVHPLLILLSVLGGLSVFGTFGFIFGPLTMSLFLALLQIYTELLHPPTRRQPPGLL